MKLQDGNHHYKRIQFVRIARKSLGACMLSLALQLYSAGAFAAGPLDRDISLDIPADTPLEEALIEWGREAHVTIMINTQTVNWKITQGVHGKLNARSALLQLLKNSSLSYTEDGDRVHVIPRDALTHSNYREQELNFGSYALSDGPHNVSSDTNDTDQDVSNKEHLQEVVVTAQKREERLQDVPIPVTVLSTESLESNNLVRIEDYYNTVPGLNFTTTGTGDMHLSIRGLSTGADFANPTVGIVVDEAPFGSSTVLGGFHTGAPDIDPSDLKQIEVLRGPQGTLYGASSIGGLIKYVTVDPSTGSWSARVQGDLTGVKNGDDVGFGFRAAANMPITDTLAMRVSGFVRHDPGYIDVPSLDLHGINRATVEGGRISMMWLPSEAWSFKLSALMQDSAQNGASDGSFPGSGLAPLQQLLTVRGGNSWDREIQSYTATVKGSFDGINFTSISGYSESRYHLLIDNSLFYDSISESNYGVGGVIEHELDKTSKFTEEVRFSSSIGSYFDWLVGVFFTHEDSPDVETTVAVVPETGATVGPMLLDPYPTTYAERAAFADFTVHFTDQFDIQLGGRESRNEQSYHETVGGVELGGATDIEPLVHTDDSSFTYLVTPRMKISESLMTYIRIASGYRPGGPNPTCVLYDAPCHYNPDKTENYELGIKGSVGQGMFSYDASLYDISWKDIQISVTAPSGLEYFTNASSARSRGLELSAETKPTSLTTISAWAVWSQAILTSYLPPTSPVIGVPGDRLPYASPFSASLTVDQQALLWGGLRGNFGTTASYTGAREGEFGDQGRTGLPGYFEVNLRTGIKGNTWTANLFCNNVADNRAILAVTQRSPTFFPPNYIQPRTIGVSFSKSF